MSRRRVLSPERMRSFAEVMKNFDYRNADHRRAIAEEITKDVKQDFLEDDVISKLGVEVEYFEEGQKLTWRTIKGMKAYVHEPGSDAPRSTVATYGVTLETELVSVFPEIEIGQLRRLGTVQSLKDQAANAILGHQYATIWNTLKGSCPSDGSLSNYNTGGSTNATRKNAVDSGFDYVADVLGSDVTAIVARRSALGFLQDASAWGTPGPSEKVKEDIDNKPFQQQYRGVPIVVLPKFSDGYGVNQIDDDNIIILGQDTIKMGVDRDIDFDEGMRRGSLMWEYHVWMKYGVCILNPERNFRVYIG